MYTDYNPAESDYEEWDEAPSEPTPTRWELLRARLLGMRATGLRVALFVAGVAAAFVALLLYQALFPPPPPLTTTDVNNSIAQAFASATPAPAFSERVYQVIQPSLILIQGAEPVTGTTPEYKVGSGVIIDSQGDILTALHVVTQTTGIQVTFADGTQSTAQISSMQPENDIAVLRADKPPAQIVPATMGNPNSMRVGDEAFAVGNPFGLYGSMSAGVISGFDRSFQPVGSDLAQVGKIDPVTVKEGAVITLQQAVQPPDHLPVETLEDTLRRF